MNHPPTPNPSAALLQACNESREQIRYWTEKAALADQPGEQTQAKARVLVWKQNLAAKTAQLNELLAQRQGAA